MVFITQANAAGIVAKVDKATLDALVGEVYERKIHAVFSKMEEKELLLFRELFREPAAFVTEYFEKHKRTDSKQYVKEGKSPAYHRRNNCERLLSDYENYRIPPDIQARGDDEIHRFRTWFNANETLLEEKPDIFLLRLSTEFKVSLAHLDKVIYANSGPEKFVDVSLDQARKEIDRILTGIDDWCMADAKNLNIIVRYRFGEKTFLRNKPIRYNQTPYSDETVKAVLSFFYSEFKKPLHDYLVLYYKVMYNPELSFENNILDQLGFRPCSQCRDESQDEGA